MFLNVGHLIQCVCTYVLFFIFFWPGAPFFQDVLGGLLIFDLARRGGGREIGFCSCMYCIQDGPGRPSTAVSYRVLQCFLLADVVSYRILHCFRYLRPTFWSHFGSILGPLGAILGPSWGHLGAILGPSVSMGIRPSAAFQSSTSRLENVCRLPRVGYLVRTRLLSPAGCNQVPLSIRRCFLFGLGRVSCFDRRCLSIELAFPLPVGRCSVCGLSVGHASPARRTAVLPLVMIAALTWP